MERSDVLVVGAGPTGLALGCDLTRRGVRTLVVERRERPATSSRAFALQARGLEILEDLGAGDVVRDATPVTGITVHVEGHPLARVRFGGLARYGHPGVYLVSQARVEAVLRERLAELGGDLRFDHELVDVRDEGGHLTAGLRRGTSTAGLDVRAGFLVGADGAHSTVRELSGIAFEGGTLPETFVIADLTLETPFDEREIATFLHPDGVAGLFPLPEYGTWRLVAQADEPHRAGQPRGDRPSDQGVPADEAGIVALTHRLLRERTGRRDVRVHGASWWSRFRIHRRLAARYRAGRVVLAGDAAHVHSPFGGQGMNLGLGDAGNLGWKLAAVVHAQAGRPLLDSYEQERRPVAAEVVDLTTSATRTVIGDHPVARFARDRVLSPLAAARADRPTVALAPPRAALERFAQLRTAYRSGPLAAAPTGVTRLAGRARPGPRPGDLAPDGPVLLHPRPAREDATRPGTAVHRTSLRRLIGGDWALLRFGPPSPEQLHAAAVATHHLGDDVVIVRVLATEASVAPARWYGSQVAEVVVEDHHGVLAAGYRPRGSESVLVRPDGHVGWRSGWPAPPLDGWLRRVLADTPAVLATARERDGDSDGQRAGSDGR